MHTDRWHHGITFNFDGDMQGALYIRGPDARIYASLDAPALQLAPDDVFELPSEQLPIRVEIISDFDTLHRLALQSGNGEIVLEGPDAECYKRYDQAAKDWLSGHRTGIHTAAVRLSMVSIRGLVFESRIQQLQETLNRTVDGRLHNPQLIARMDDLLELAQQLKEIPEVPES